MSEKTIAITRSRLHELAKLVWAEAYGDGWMKSADEGGYPGASGKAAKKSVRKDYPYSISSDYVDSLFVCKTLTCKKCGDALRHDDDGPTLCRFCSAAHPDKPGDQAAQQVEAK